MRIGGLRLASLLSLGLSAATALLWALSYGRPGLLRLGNDYSAQWRNGRFEISNLGHFILHDTSDTAGRLKPRVREAPILAAGAFYRIEVPCGPTSVGFALLPAIWLVRARRERVRKSCRQHRPVCGSCGYSLIGDMSHICPECGASISAPSRDVLRQR